MDIQVTINNITGETPYEIYLCQGDGTGCFYMATISTLPYVFNIPPPYNSSLQYMLKIIDNNGCIITGVENVDMGITPTPTITNTQTPTNTPTNTETPTNTPTNTETPTNTPTNTETPTQTPTVTPTVTPTPLSFPQIDSISFPVANFTMLYINIYIDNDGGSPITQCGVVYNTTGNPTTADNVILYSNILGLQGQNFTRPIPGQPYYFAAFATNSVGTSYLNYGVSGGPI
jgi:hypothetical protein